MSNKEFMEGYVNNDKTRMSAIFGFLLLMALLFFLTLMNIRSGYYSSSFYWGLLIGILPGIATCLHLYDTWDPENLRPKSENTKTLDPKWIPLVVASGIIMSRVLGDLVPTVVRQLINGVVGSWLFITVGYMVIQAWRYR